MDRETKFSRREKGTRLYKDITSHLPEEAAVAVDVELAAALMAAAEAVDPVAAGEEAVLKFVSDKL